MKLVAVVGARQLPASWSGKVQQVVADLVKRGCRIGSGGALGADFFALQATIGTGACEGSKMFLPGSVMQAPATCRGVLLQFQRLGGEVVQGSVAGRGTDKSEYIKALFDRTLELVKASSGVVAFIAGDSKGTWFTCEQAARLGKQVVVFSADGPQSMRSLGCGRWVPVTGAWEGAWRWVPSVPTGQRCKHGIQVECCSGTAGRNSSRRY